MRRLNDCDAIENEDYDSVEISTVSGGTPKKEHIIKLDIAKEMAMLERNEKGQAGSQIFYSGRKEIQRKCFGQSVTGTQSGYCRR